MMGEHEIISAIETSLIDYLHIIAKNGNRPFVLTDFIGWVKTYPTAWSNYIFYANFEDSNMDEHIESIISKITNGELPNEWLISPKSSPLDLGKCLEKHNFSYKYSMAGMAIDLSKLECLTNTPDNLRIEIVNTKSKLDKWCNIVSNGIFSGEPFEACLFENLLNDPDYVFYIGYFNEIAVATSMLMITHEIPGIEMVTTLSEYQGMGIGTAMTVTPLLQAKKLGYKMGVLQASNAGEPIYLKIGFKEYFRFQIYKLQNDDL